MKILYIIITLLGCFFITKLLIKQFIKRAYQKDLLDKPNERKLQIKAIPTSGGVPLFVGLLISLVFALMLSLIELNELIIFSFGGVILLLGYIDDRKNLNAKTRFLIEIILGITIAFFDYRIHNFNGFLTIEELPIIWQYIITVFAVVLIVNAFNLIDGVDGLLGGISLINMIVFSFLFLYFNQLALSFFSILIGIGILVFLTFNFNPAKIFMGDAGSLFLGLITTILSIELINSSPQENSLYLMIVFAMIMIPVFDTLRVFFIRMLRKKSPFSADQNHAHHYLIKFGFNHKKVVLFIYLSHILICSLVIITYDYLKNDTLVVLFIATVSLSELITHKKVVLHKLHRLKKILVKKEMLKETPFVQKHL
jgi:UDP-N-acetylmuramyl pentapeptide phosphotransferase/UDP-N-acetylglucosamine-1-phosphate transferase